MGAITQEGFIRPTYAQILEKQEARARQLFGNDIDTGEQTALGKFIRIQVYDLAECYEEMEGVYYARFPNFADGVNLDRLMPFAGIVRNPAKAAEFRVRFTGTPDSLIPAGFLVATRDGVTFRTEEDLTIGEEGWAEAPVTCTRRGPVGNVGPGTITVIVNPDARVSGIEQLVPQLQWGRERESDAELRARFNVAISGIGSATLDAVRAAIMRVQGVSGCVVLENDSEETSPEGIPPHSFEAFVLVDSATDYEVAQAIFSKKPLGIHSYGDVSVVVLDDANGEHTVQFSKVQNVNVQVKVYVRYDNQWPSDGTEKVAEGMAEYVNRFSNGTDLMYTSLYPPVYQITGVREVYDLLISADGGQTFARDNVLVSAAQAVRLDKAHVSVEAEPYVDR
ncbi:baseplate J/gp47 family protein [Ruminococcaceae bacterium OttesenSCG-928-I18]|nr:baseplate J/gp47 family protein [Ruminococcaceae bacterium OttesenSCG-928-I18]